MCLAIPVKIEEIDNGVANCRVGESDTFIKVALMLMEGEVEIGDYIIVHAGFALRKLDPVEAEESLKVLRELAEKTFQEEARF